MPSIKSQTTDWPICGEKFYGFHNYNKAREARALFEATKCANDPYSHRAIGDLSYRTAEDAESHG